MARPTKEESLLRKLDANKTSVNEKAVASYIDMYEIIEKVARNSKAADATRISAAKYVMERAEQTLTEQEREVKLKAAADEDNVGFGSLISTTYDPEPPEVLN